MMSQGKHMKLQRWVLQPAMAENFTVLKKCRSKLDCLFYKMLIIKELKPSLNVQSDLIRAKLFTDVSLKYLHNIKHCGMCIVLLDIQNDQLSLNNFDISIKDLNLENDVWYIATSIIRYFNFSCKVLQQATPNKIQ